jgi:adenine-specific DNA methylase
VQIEVKNFGKEDQEGSPSPGTISGKSATCAACGVHVTTSFLQQEGTAGRLGERLYAVCELLPNKQRLYREPTSNEQEIAFRVPAARTPAVPLDWNGIRHIWALQYGIETTRDLHTPRQHAALDELVFAVREVLADRAGRLERSALEGLALLLGVTLNRMVMYGNRSVWWQSNGEFPANIFVRQAISMVWSFVEIPLISPGAAGWNSAADWVRKAAEHLVRLPSRGRVLVGDAASLPRKSASVDLVFTDPPYYDSITYSYLADLFVGWMRAAIGDYLLAPLEALPVNRAEEAIVDRPHAMAPSPKDDAHFRRKMQQAFDEIRRVLVPGGTLVVMYGHKKPSAWAALFEPLLEAGLVPVESWPVHTERKQKFRHGRIGALSTSCVVVCRAASEMPKRQRTTWPEFEKHLSAVLEDTIEQCESLGLHGADLAAALIAPAVSAWSSQEVVGDEGRKWRLDQLFARLPALGRECERNVLWQRLTKSRSDQVALAAKALENGATEDAEGYPPLLRDAIGHSVALNRGDMKTADSLAARWSNGELAAILRLQALCAGTDTEPEREALASVSRLSMRAIAQEAHRP